MMTGKLVSALTLTILLSGAASAKTLYVDSGFGDDGNACTKKELPCETLVQAITNAASNDRILVGPGRYPVVNSLSLTDGLKLQSLAGAAATIIDGTAVEDDEFGILDTDADRTRIGARGKGFTILMEESAESGGIYIYGGRSPRVEGNRIFNLGSSPAPYGIRINSPTNPTIRYNTVGGGYASESGFNVGIGNNANGNDDPGADRAIISDNRVFGAFACIFLTSTLANHRNKVTNNLLEPCVAGIYAGNNGPSSGDRYTGNSIETFDSDSASLAGGILIDRGNPQISKNLIHVDDRNAYSSFNAIKTENTTNSKITDNVISGSELGYVGIQQVLPNTLNSTITGNTIVRPDVGIVIEGDAIKSLGKNNITASIRCAIGLSAEPTSVKKLNRNFYGTGGLPNDPDCSPFDTESAVTNGLLIYNPASKPNPIKAKDRFN